MLHVPTTDARCTMHRLTPQPHHVFVVRFFPVAVFVVCVVVCVVCVVCVVRASKYQKSEHQSIRLNFVKRTKVLVKDGKKRVKRWEKEGEKRRKRWKRWTKKTAPFFLGRPRIVHFHHFHLPFLLPPVLRPSAPIVRDPLVVTAQDVHNAVFLVIVHTHIRLQSNKGEYWSHS